MLKLGVVVKNSPLEKILVLTNNNPHYIRMSLEVINNSSSLLLLC